MNTLTERKEAVSKEIEAIMNYLIDKKESPWEVFNHDDFNKIMNDYVVLTTITLKEIVKELALNGDNVVEYENMDVVFNSLHLEFKKIYDDKILLKKEQDTLREIKEITEYLGNFMDGNSNVIFNSIIFNKKLEKYVELSMTLKTISDELEMNGHNIEIYENMPIELDSCYQEFKKFLDEKNKLL
jgi:hypothetical protein